MNDLYERWMKGRADKQRARDVAAAAGVSEAELVASAAGSDGRASWDPAK